MTRRLTSTETDFADDFLFDADADTAVSAPEASMIAFAKFTHRDGRSVHVTLRGFGVPSIGSLVRFMAVWEQFSSYMADQGYIAQT